MALPLEFRGAGGSVAVPVQGSADSVEGVTAGAATARVRVVDREALLLDGVREVDRGAVQVGGAILSTTTSTPSKSRDQVAVERALVEVQLVDEAGAATRLDRDPQAQVVAVLLGQQSRPCPRPRRSAARRGSWWSRPRPERSSVNSVTRGGCSQVLRLTSAPRLVVPFPGRSLSIGRVPGPAVQG